MGIVYLAEQTEPVQRKVALKILKLGMDTLQVVARFESERQALAVMEHPGIAKVYDAGATESGRPYFVMERVDGVPITEHCDAQRLPVRARIELFLQVCRAVQHAHQKGVIHRDLKPSNVLVTATDDGPLCKIIDFGIARAVAESPSDGTRLTRVDQSIGTPAYMSPEQAGSSGLDVDTRTDVYSLGVLLYELMVGALPFEPQAYAGWAFLAHHVSVEPPRPSVRVAQLGEAARAAAELRGTTAEALRRELSGDLDWIVVRAMEKERERRYETANQLGEDLARHLSHEPVLASPPSRSYRARKFVRRNRLAVGFSAALAILLVGFSVAVTAQNQRIDRARGLALTRQGQAEDLIGFMLGDLRGKLTPLGRLDVLDDVGAQAMSYFAAVPEGELTDQELFRRSQALSQLGQVRLDQGQFPAARAAFEESLRLAAGLAARQPENLEWQVGLGAAHFWIGYAYWLQGDLDAALESFEPYMTISRALVEREPGNPDYRLELGYAWSNIGSIREAQGRLEDAADAFRQTLAIKQSLVEIDTTRGDWRFDLAETHNTLGVVLRKMRRLAEAEAEHRAEVGIKEGLVAADPLNATWRRHLGTAHVFLGRVLEARGDPAAIASFAAARDIAREGRRRDSTNAQWQLDLAVALRRHAVSRAHRGAAGDALAELAASRSLTATLLAGDSTVVPWIRERALGAIGTAEALLAAGRYGEALTAGSTAVADAERLLSRSQAVDDVLIAASADVALGRALASGGSPEPARRAWRRGLQRLDSLGGPASRLDHDVLRATLLLLADDREAARQQVEALYQLGYRAEDLVSLARSRGVAGPG